jgi:hypothetical protein
MQFIYFQLRPYGVWPPLHHWNMVGEAEPPSPTQSAPRLILWSHMVSVNLFDD